MGRGASRRSVLSRCIFLAALLTAPDVSAQDRTALEPPVLPEAPEPPSHPGGGEALFDLDVDAHGEVTAIEVLSGSAPEVETLARTYAGALRFVPARRNGVAIPARVRYRLVLRDVTHDPAGAEPARRRPRPSAPIYESVTRDRAPPPEPTTHGLSRIEASSVPGSLGDPLRAVQSFPGVARPGLTAGELIVRGASPWDTGVVIDGHPVPQLYHFLQGPAILNPAFLEDVQFHPGGWGARNGRKMAGLIEVRSRRLDAARPRLEVEVDLIDAGVMASTPVAGGGTFGAALRRSILGDFLDDITGQTAVPIYYDLQARYDLPAGEWGELTLMLFGSDDQLVFPVPENVQTLTGPGGETLENETLLTRMIATLRGTRGPVRLSLSPAFGYDRIVVQTGSDRLDYRLLTLRCRFDADWNAHRLLAVRAGVDVERQNFDFRFRLPGTDPFIGEFPTPQSEPYLIENAGKSQITLLGAYSELEANLGRARAVLGLRADEYRFPEGNHRTSLEPRVSAELRASSRIRVKASGGIYRQAPLPRDLSGDFGNPELDLERTTQLALGAELDLEGVSIELEAFRNRLENGVMGSSRLVERNGVVTYENLRNGLTGTSRGLELLARRPSRYRVSGWLSYTLSKAERAYPGGDPELFAYDQTHIFHAVIAINLGAGLRLSGQWSYVTGNPIYPITGATFDLDTDRYRARYGEFGSTRIPPFHQLDVRLEKSFALWGGQARAYIEVLNAYDRRNPELLMYSYDYGQRGYFTGLPILGTLGLGGSF